MPLQATSGAATYDAFGSAAADRVYIEDVFSTYLYTGNGSTQTITNGIDLSTKGGMVFQKARSAGLGYSFVYDTARGAAKFLETTSTAAQGDSSLTQLSSFNSNGFSLSYSSGNDSGYNFASWTFRKQPKFFDVVTYTGNGSTLSVNHALASKPGCIIIKRTDSTSDGLVCTRKSTGNIYAMYLNTTAGQFYDGTEGSLWTSTAVSINWINSNVAAGFNTNGATYVMYLFAHDAGGFGLSGTDNVISCGSFTSSSVGYAEVNLGYEPQFYLRKQVDSAANWQIVDNMRGFTVTESKYLYPNTSGAEGSTGSSASPIRPTATGFIDATLANNATYIYIAIRRGPMKVPTSGTSVFTPLAYTGTGTQRSITSVGRPTDTLLSIRRSGYGGLGWGWWDRLRGTNGTANRTLVVPSTGAEQTGGESDIVSFDQLGVTYGSSVGWGFTNSGNVSGLGDETYINYFFRRAPGFFDVVCWTGDGAASKTLNHNLAVSPELVIQKARSTTSTWIVYRPGIVGSLRLNTTAAIDSNPSQSATATTFDTNVSTNTITYVTYLFATVAGVSKVGSYTGNGSNQTINCGFTGGARFVLIKRTDSTGDWYCWDSARGIVSGNDPHLSLNTTAAEVTTDDSVDTDSTGFIVNQLAATNINVSSASYIFLAVA